MYLVTDTCYECSGMTVAVFYSKEDADSFTKAYPWLGVEEVDVDELLIPDSSFGYQKWFNDRADRALQERSYDCGE